MKRVVLILAAAAVAFFICLFALLFVYGPPEAYPHPDAVTSTRIHSAIMLVLLIAAEVFLTVKLFSKN